MASAPKRVLVSWSTGKDSAWTLHTLLAQPDKYTVVGLFSTASKEFRRVAMHGVRQALLEAQAAALGLPVQIVDLPHPCTCEIYNDIMGEFNERVKRELSIDCIAFGDLFLEDVRDFRVKQLAGTGIEPIFPLWLQPTDTIVQTMLAAGLRAVITTVDPKQLPREAAGQELTAELLASPTFGNGADPCGEKGEFHTFVFDGPMFKDGPLPIVAGEVVERDGFIFADFLLKESPE